MYCFTSDKKSEKKILTYDEKALASRFAVCKSTKRLMNNRHFLIENRSYIEPFCLPVTIDRLAVNAAPLDFHISEFPPLLSSPGPEYINAEIRDYQLEGINQMIGWYERGVGGILADEMVNK